MLTADLIRLKRMAYFATKFKLAALDQGIDIAGQEALPTRSFLTLLT